MLGPGLVTVVAASTVKSCALPSDGAEELEFFAWRAARALLSHGLLADEGEQPMERDAAKRAPSARAAGEIRVTGIMRVLRLSIVDVTYGAFPNIG